METLNKRADEEYSKVDTYTEKVYNKRAPNLLGKTHSAKKNFIPKTAVAEKVFKPYDENESEANERATRWAHKPSTVSGDRALISCRNVWYMIEI